MGKLSVTSRALAALAVVSASATGGMVVYHGYRVHDDTRLAVEYLVQPWEGRKLHAYLDTLPKPPRWTVCDGDTTDVGPNTVETPEGCNRRTMVKMERDYRPVLTACIPNWDSHPRSWRSMMLSLAWNIGTGRRSGGDWSGGACGSSAARIVREAVRGGKKPDYSASCVAATAYKYSGGVFYIGLANRREMGDRTRIGEGEMCVSGLGG